MQKSALGGVLQRLLQPVVKLGDLQSASCMFQEQIDQSARKKSKQDEQSKVHQDPPARYKFFEQESVLTNRLKHNKSYVFSSTSP